MLRTAAPPTIPAFFGEQVENKAIRFGFYGDYALLGDLKFFVQGNNILNDYRYEYSSEYPTHGATWLFGFRYNHTKNQLPRGGK